MRRDHVLIIVPYTKDCTETVQAIGATGRIWSTCPVVRSDDAYHGLLADLWSMGSTFAIIEHDITVTPEALDSLEQCPADWCACPYPYMGALYAGLGCTRFTADLTARHPDLMTAVADMSDKWHPPRHWCRLDEWIRQTLTRAGEQRCETHPTVGHRDGRDTRPAHGCC